MKINIINLSNIPWIISKEELNLWLSYIKSIGFFIDEYNINNIDYNINLFNSLLKKNSNEIILFSSWWFNAINNIYSIEKFIWKWKKIILWFSDTLHIQTKFFNNSNVYNIYGITLRNIFDLDQIEKDLLLNFIHKQVFITALRIESEKYNSINGIIYWWQLMIFITVIDIYWIKINTWDILYLEFHWMEDYLIEYYLNVLKIKWIYNKISWIILEDKISNYDKDKLIIYFNNNWVNNIYSLNWVSFIPFYKNITINKWELILNQ